MSCFLTRWMISNALDNRREPSARVFSHIEQCDSCRSYHEEAVALNGHLAKEVRPDSEYPEFLHARIMNAVKSDHHLKLWKPVRLLAVGAVATAIVFGISAVWFTGSGPSRPNTAVAVDSEWGSLQQLESGLGQAGTLLNQGPDLLVRPLSDEVQSLENDIGKVVAQLGSILDRDIFNMIADQS